MKKIIFILYGFTLLVLTLFSYAFIDPNLIYYEKIFTGFASQNRTITTAIYTVLLVVLFLFYFYVLRLVHKKSIGMREIWLIEGITCLFLFFSYPAMLSFDIFNYVTTAKVLFFYQENPYVIMPIEFLGDSFLLFTHAANKLALYGPGWILLTGIPYFLGVDNFFLTLISFKLVVVIFYLGTILLLWKMTKNVFSVAVFAFNPLVVIEILVSGHNDIVMMFLVLLAFFLIKQKKYLYAVCFFFASILIKYATIFLLPVFLFMLWKAYKHRSINWEKIYYASFLSMLAIFLLSPLREEMYPWYAVWLLPFLSLLPDKKNILYLSIAFSLGLMLRYIPFMYSGTHFGLTPYLRIILASLPVVLVGIALLLSSLMSFPRTRESRR